MCQPRRILVVEDSIVSGMLMEARLNRSKPDYEVHLRKSMKGALEEMDKFDPELTLLDLSLPDSSAHETCRNILRFKSNGGKVMIITGDEEEKWNCLNAGADDFVLKAADMDPEHFIARVDKLLPTYAGTHSN